MEKEIIKVEAEEAGLRLDKLLTRRLAGRVSRTLAQRLIREGRVRVAGKSAKSHHLVRRAEVIEIELPPPSSWQLVSEKLPVEIAYEDENLLVVNKPSGMPTHPGPGHSAGTLVNALLGKAIELSREGGKIRPGIVHRLDKDVSGLLLVAKDDFTHRRLAEQFKEHTVLRQYLAVVKGRVALDEGVVEAPIGRHHSDRKKMAVRFIDSRSAITFYRVVRRDEDRTLLELTLKTGRTHQVRVHLRHLGYPLLGDKTYGLPAGYSRPLLHAWKIGFRHPRTGKYLEFTSPPPAEFN